MARSRSNIQDTDERRSRMDKKAMFYGTYPWVDAEQYPSGHQTVHGNEEGAEYHRTESRSHVHERLASSNNRETIFNLGPSHTGSPQGTTSTIGKSRDSMTVENERSGVFGSGHGETKKWQTSATGKGTVSKRDGPAAAGSLGSTWSVSASSSAGGDSTGMVDGDQHSSTRGDKVAYHVGTHVTVNKGERYEDIQNGNKGTVVEGKYSTNASKTSNHKSGSDYTIESSTMIRLKVGSCYVEIKPNYIMCYYNDPTTSMLVTQEHVHIRKNDNRIFVDDQGCWSTKPIVTKNDPYDSTS